MHIIASLAVGMVLLLFTTAEAAKVAALYTFSHNTVTDLSPTYNTGGTFRASSVGSGPDPAGHKGAAATFSREKANFPRIMLPNNVAPKGFSAYSVSAWFRRTTNDAGGLHWWSISAGGNHNYERYAFVGKDLQVICMGSYHTFNNVINYNEPNTQWWTHVNVVRMGRDLIVVVNGTKVLRKTNVVSSNVFSSSISGNAVWVGNDQDSLGGGFSREDGFVGDIARLQIIHGSTKEAEWKQFASGDIWTIWP